MKLRNIKLSLSNIAQTTNAKTLIANEVSEIREKNTDGTLKDNAAVIGLAVTCMARRGDSITIKFPLDVKPQWEELKKLLSDDALTEISLEGLKLTPFALVNSSGNLLSGVSAKADSFTIVKSSKDEILDDLEIM